MAAKREDPYSRATRRPAYQRTTMFPTRCTAPKCRNSLVRSRQGSPPSVAGPQFPPHAATSRVAGWTSDVFPQKVIATNATTFAAISARTTHGRGVASRKASNSACATKSGSRRRVLGGGGGGGDG